MVCLYRLSRVQLFVTTWTVAYQARSSKEFSKQEYWSDTGIEPRYPTLQADALPSEPPGKHYAGFSAQISYLWWWRCLSASTGGERTCCRRDYFLIPERQKEESECLSHTGLFFFFFKDFFDQDHFRVYWICYNIASVLRFGFLTSSHADPSSPTRDQTCTPCTGRLRLNHWTTREVSHRSFK